MKVRRSTSSSAIMFEIFEFRPVKFAGLQKR